MGKKGKKNKLTPVAAHARVCKVCVKQKKCVRPSTEKYEALIARHYRDDLDPKDESLPTGICSSCRMALGNLESGRAGKHFLPPRDHYDYRSVQEHYNFSVI